MERIVAGLEKFQPFPGRGKVIALRRKVHILDDSYNANPDSLEATLAAFAEMKGKNRGFLVLGDMLELGSGSAEAHKKAGERIGEMEGAGHLFLLGEQAEDLAEGAQSGRRPGKNVRVAPTQEALEGLEEIRKRRLDFGQGLAPDAHGADHRRVGRSMGEGVSEELRGYALLYTLCPAQQNFGL